MAGRPPSPKTTPATAVRALPGDAPRTQAVQDRAALALTQQNQRVAALATQLNYNGSTDPSVLENSALDAIRRIGMGVFELGAYLLLLKEACEHGKFGPALERIGISADTAGRYMAVTRRFANSATMRNLEAAGIAKLAELLLLEDGQFKDLTEFGQTGELALDDVARMSVKELRTAVRKERGLSSRHKTEIERLQAVNAELADEALRIKRAKPDEARAALHAEAAGILNDLLGRVRGAFRHALIALGNDGERGANAVLMAGMVGQLAAELADLRDEFDLRDVVGDGRPEWQQWAAAQGIATPASENGQ